MARLYGQIKLELQHVYIYVFPENSPLALNNGSHAVSYLSFFQPRGEYALLAAQFKRVD